MINIRTCPSLETYAGTKLVRTGGSVIITIQADTLVGVDLSCLVLDWAYLPNTDLRDANFTQSSMVGVNLSYSDISGANLENADLAGSNLQGANMAYTNLNGAWMAGVRLQGADLRFARLEMARLRYARYDEETQWPEGFDPQKHGAELPSQVRQ